MALTGGGSSGGGSSGSRGSLADAPYQVGTQIVIDNTSNSNNITVYTVPAGKKFIGIIQRNQYFEWTVNDVVTPIYLNGIYGSSSTLYSIPATKIHLVAGSVLKKYGSNNSHLRVLGVESDA